MLSISFNDFFLSFQAPNEVRDSADAFSAPRGFIARLGSHTTCPKRGGGSYATPLEPLVAPALQRSAVVVAALSAMLIFMGGLPTMISKPGLLLRHRLWQGLYTIHSIDNAKL